MYTFINIEISKTNYTLKGDQIPMNSEVES